MNAPDLDATKPLTVDAVMLFQRFRQDEDVAFVDSLLEEEIRRHLKVCEYAILQAAYADIFWADLPRDWHDTVELSACDALKKAGFKIEFQQSAHQVRIHTEGREDTHATVVNSRHVAKWFFARANDEENVSAECQRRRALQNEDIVAPPPARRSRGLGDKLESGEAIWATVVGGWAVAEVQRVYGRPLLCIFTSSGELLHLEPTNVAYGAMFGPDAGDVAEWQNRVISIINGWKRNIPQAPTLRFDRSD